MRGILMCALAFTALLGISGCAKSPVADDISICGSDIMVILSEKWAEDYSRERPEVAIKVSGGGSTAGIAALIKGRLDICQSSRSFTPEEAAAYERRHGGKPREIEVARDGIVIYANAKSRVQALSVAQLKALFAGKMTDWRSCGGEPGRVVLFGPAAGSGTARHFRKAVLGDLSFANGVRQEAGTAGVIAAVGEERRGLGFGGPGYAGKAKVIPIRARRGKPAVAPSLESFGDGSYPLTRGLYYLTAAEPPKRVADFLLWITSPAGQDSARAAGYYPVRDGRAIRKAE